MAFGFRPARSAADGAAVPEVLLELGRLKEWTVVAMGLDYRKCFDVMPQGIGFEVSTRLGFDSEVLAVLKVVYCQVVPPFKLAGGLGHWRRATNRILQGCPLSVILIIALMEASKAELDSLREQVVVVTKDFLLCRTLDVDEFTSVILDQQGPEKVDIGSGDYADDTGVVAPRVAAAWLIFPATKKCLQLTGHYINAGKSTVWTLDSDLG